MTIESYSELKQQVIDWSHRGDIDLRTPLFIQMAETEMFANDQQILLIRGQEVLDSSEAGGRYLPLPEGYIKMRSIKLITAGGSWDMQYVAPDKMKIGNEAGLPTQFTVTTQIEFNRIPDGAYTAEINYYKEPSALSDDNETNEVLDENPSIYLFGALWAVFIYAVDEAEAAKYYALFMNAIKGANKRSKKGRYGPSPAMYPSGSTP